jgi:hypothetical protein
MLQLWQSRVVSPPSLFFVWRVLAQACPGASRQGNFFSPFFLFFLSFCRSQHRKIAGKGNYSVLGKWTQFL